MIISMASVSSNSSLAQFMKVSGKIIGFMAKGLFGMLGVISMQASLNLIKRTDMGSTFMRMALDMKGTG